MQRLTVSVFLAVLTLAAQSAYTDAQRRGAGGVRGGGSFSAGGGIRGAGFSRASARPSVTSPVGDGFSRPSAPAASQLDIRPPVRLGDNTRGGDLTNVGIDRPINIRDDDVIVGGGRMDPGYGCCYRYPVAAAAGATLGAASATAVIGSAVYSLPAGCSVVVLNGFTYDQCGDVWYQPQFVGTDATYIVVAPPR